VNPALHSTVDSIESARVFGKIQILEEQLSQLRRLSMQALARIAECASVVAVNDRFARDRSAERYVEICETEFDYRHAMSVINSMLK
jgi:hypothetical protein